MDFSSGLRHYRGLKGVTQKELANAIGANNTTVSNWEKGIAKPDMDTLVALSNYFGISADELIFFGGSAPEIRSFPKEGQERVATAHPSNEGIPLIPLDAVAGFCSGNSAQVLEYECERFVVPTFRGAEFMIPVKGSSMYPKYSSGDIVACKCLPLDTFFQWNKVYVVDTEQGVLIKRVNPGRDDDHILLISENEKYPPFELHRSQIISLAIVIGVIRLE